METLQEPIELEKAELAAVAGGVGNIYIGIIASSANGLGSKAEVVIFSSSGRFELHSVLTRHRQ